MIPDTTASWTPAERAAFMARRRSRNIALGLLLTALVVLFYGITVVRMAPGIKDAAPTAAQTGTSVPNPAP